MDTKNRPFEDGQKESLSSTDSKEINNPFENNQSVEQDIAQSEEDLQNEQLFKQAQTERD